MPTLICTRGFRNRTNLIGVVTLASIGARVLGGLDLGTFTVEEGALYLRWGAFEAPVRRVEGVASGRLTSLLGLDKFDDTFGGGER